MTALAFGCLKAGCGGHRVPNTDARSERPFRVATVHPWGEQGATLPELGNRSFSDAELTRILRFTEA